MTPSHFAWPLSLLLASGCVHNPDPSLCDRPEVEKACTREESRGNDAQAKISCDLELEFAPQDAQLWTQKGLIALHDGDTRLARESFIKAIRFDPEQSLARMHLRGLSLDETDAPLPAKTDRASSEQPGEAR